MINAALVQGTPGKYYIINMIDAAGSLTFSSQPMRVGHGRRHQGIHPSSLLCKTDRPGLHGRPAALRGSGKSAWRPSGIARQAHQGGSFHARSSFCGSSARMTAAADAQPAALWVVTCSARHCC